MLQHRLPATTTAPLCPPTTIITDLLTLTTAVHLLIVLPATADRPTAVLHLTVLPVTADRQAAPTPTTAATPTTTILLPATADLLTAALHQAAPPAIADLPALPAVTHHPAVPPATADLPAPHPAATVLPHPAAVRPAPTTVLPATAATPALPAHPLVQAAATAAVRTHRAARTPAVHIPAALHHLEDKTSDDPTDHRHHYTNCHNLSLLQNIAGGLFASRRPVVTI